MSQEKYIGMDVHQAAISVALPIRRSEGTIAQKPPERGEIHRPDYRFEPGTRNPRRRGTTFRDH